MLGKQGLKLYRIRSIRQAESALSRKEKRIMKSEFLRAEQPVACVRSWGKNVLSGNQVIGTVCVTDRAWGAFDQQGNLISANHHSEHVARAAVLARANRRCGDE